MKKIQHPGKLIRKLCLDPLGLSITDAAKLIKVLRTNLSLILNGKRGISPTMAIRLEQVFNTDARKWLELQLEYDLTIARKKRLNLKKISSKRVKTKK